MDDHDRANLMFLLNADEETLRDWYEQMDEDDIEYAFELLAQYRDELSLRASFTLVEQVDLTNLTPDADEYIKKFTLGKK